MSKEEFANLQLMLVDAQELEWGEIEAEHAWPDPAGNEEAEMIAYCFERR